MRWKVWKGTVFRRCLAAALILTLLIIPVQGVNTKDEAYIVKYKGTGASLMDSGAPFRVVSRDELDQLLEEDLLEWYEPDGTAELIDPVPPERASLQGALSPWYADEMWHLDMIGAETAYEMGAAGEGVRVAVIDSGANRHPDLEDRMEAGWNYLSNSTVTGDSNGHGTAVCGLIAGGGESGMVGTAPKANLIPLKCFEGTTTQSSLVCEAIWDAVDHFDCDVINLSVGIRSESIALREAVDHAVENGVILVAAVGNGGTRTEYYPAAYEEVIGVGEVDSAGLVYKGSNHNGSVLLTAPGAEVISLDRLGGYGTFTGCSFATPMVTGAVADLLSLEPDLTMEEVSAILSESAMDRGKPGWDEYYGWGILNLRGCVLALEQDFRLTAPRLREGRWYTTAVNRSDSDAACLLIIACYGEDGKQTAVTVERRLLSAHGREVLDLPEDACRVFLCDMEFRPLAPALEVPQK